MKLIIPTMNQAKITLVKTLFPFLDARTPSPINIANSVVTAHPRSTLLAIKKYVGFRSVAMFATQTGVDHLSGIVSQSNQSVNQ